MRPARRQSVLASVRVLLLAAMSGCAVPRPPGPPAFDTSLSSAEGLGWVDRLRALPGPNRPTVEEVVVPPGTDPSVAGAVPVVRLSFPEGVFFDTDSDVPKAGGLQVIASIAQELEAGAPPLHATVVGHTDDRGSDAYNLALSRRRAAVVAAALRGDGVRPADLDIVAAGRREPVDTSDTDEGRARNRRVEFLISPSRLATLALEADRPEGAATVVGSGIGVGAGAVAGAGAGPVRPLLPPPAEPEAAAPAPEAAPGGFETASPAPPAAPDARQIPDRPSRPQAGALAAETEREHAAGPAVRRVPAPEPRYVPNTPELYQPQTLGPAQTF